MDDHRLHPTAVRAHQRRARCTPPDEALDAEALRQRACTELLRQAAHARRPAGRRRRAGADGAISEAASDGHRGAAGARAGRARAVGRGLPPPLRRAPRALPHRRARARVRHILFAVTPGVDVVALRNRAEAALLDVRCHDDGEADRFAGAARELSNCPSGAQGGDLGWLDARRLRARVRARAVRPAPRSACCRAWCTAASACTWSRCWRARPASRQPFEAVRGAVAHGAAPAGLRHGAAPVPAAAGRRGRGRGRGPRRRRHAAGAIGACSA